MDSARPKQQAALTLRRGTPDDAAVLGKICYEAFAAISNAHNFPEDFPNAETATGLMTMLLSQPDAFYSSVAEIGGEVVGSNFLWESDVVAGVGPITIDVSSQNASVGKQLMIDVMNRAEEKNALSTRLVQAAYHNRSLSLYTKLGFDVVEPLSQINGTPLKIAVAGTTVRQMTRADLTHADELSLNVHGHTRHNEVAGAIEQGTARVVERAGRITGYTTGVGFFGHAVAETNDDLKALIADADQFGGPGFLLPSRNSDVFRWCLENGLRVIQPMTLMSKGYYREPQGAFLPSILF
jgi:predicted N-acetyltransferase YhbS